MFFVAQVYNDDISRCFFYFFKILVSGVLEEGGGLKGKNGPKWQKKIVSLSISGTVPDSGFWYTCVKW